MNVSEIARARERFHGVPELAARLMLRQRDPVDGRRACAVCTVTVTVTIIKSSGYNLEHKLLVPGLLRGTPTSPGECRPK